MRILHLSDLHRAGSSETLKAIWNGPQSALRKLPEAEQKFDFIVVSGDLAGAARPGEYDELLEFTSTSLLPLLRDPEARERVVFVPGNHDVDWSADLGDPLRISDLLNRPGGSDELAHALRLYRDDPARSGIRQVISKYGHIEWLKLDEARGGARFATVQRFLDAFYGDRLARAPLRKFDLTQREEGHDWSAHVFPDERLAIYGFNSCFLNDRHWTGAAIARESIANAAAHASEHADQCLRIAVWHHGIHTDSYRPDYLNQADLGAIIVAGFQVGLHGHIHKAGGAQLGWLTDRFVLVGVGSLGANQNQRPDAVGKQFAVVQVHPHQVHVQVYERAGDMAVYTRRPARTYPLGARTEQDPHEVSAGEHVRKIHIDRHGISTVDVALTELRATTPVVIAEVGPPTCDARAEPRGAGGLEIRRSTAQDGTIRFTLYPHHASAIDLRWRYQASNVIPLTQAEVPLYHLTPARGLGGGHDTTVLRAHIVRLACRRLTLHFTFDEPIVDEATVEKRVDRLVEQNGASHWERDEPEQRRCELIKRSPTEFTLAIEAPILGHRYAITYKPTRPGHVLSYRANRIAAKLLDRIYGDREQGYELFDQLTAGTAEAIAAVFGAPPHDLTWIGLLWDERQGLLVPAFGDFPSREWATQYRCGAGVAGHAFRFNRPAAWCRTTEHTKNALIYQHSGPAQFWRPEHDWILCFPLLVGDPQAGPIGVVQLEGSARHSGLGDRLRELASAAIHDEVVKGSTWEGLQQSLSSTVNTGFWQACALAESLADYRGYVREVISQMHLGVEQLAGGA